MKIPYLTHEDALNLRTTAELALIQRNPPEADPADVKLVVPAHNLISLIEQAHSAQLGLATTGELKAEVIARNPGPDTYRTFDPGNANQVHNGRAHNGLDTDKQVFFYGTEFYCLSNFSAFRLIWGGHDFDTSEHAYQAAKFATTRTDIAGHIRLARSAHDAFKIAEAQRGWRRKDWDEVKVEVMRSILRAKAGQHEYVRRKLLETDDRELIEDSWRDGTWGCGADRQGQNLLGKLWMEIRAELRARGAS